MSNQPWLKMYKTSLGPKAKHTSNRELRRQATKAIEEGAKVYATLLACLAQSGGEIVVTQGTIDQVGQNLARLGYVIENNATSANPQIGEFTVRMVEGEGEADGVAEQQNNPNDRDDHERDHTTSLS
jgi:hypothetical protein